MHATENINEFSRETIHTTMEVLLLLHQSVVQNFNVIMSGRKSPLYCIHCSDTSFILLLSDEWTLIVFNTLPTE